MRPQRPYLLRAFYDWLLDSELTPHIVVDANYEGVEIPLEFVRDGQIILNIAPSAVSYFEMDHDAVSFNARFGGVPRQVYAPIGALLAIYARENSAGTMFQPEDYYDNPKSEPLTVSDNKPKVVMQLVEDNDDSTADEPEDNPPQPPTQPKGRPSLRVVK